MGFRAVPRASAVRFTPDAGDNAAFYAGKDDAQDSLNWLTTWALGAITGLYAEAHSNGLTDPGNAGTIAPTTSGLLEMSSGGTGQTRTLAAPTFLGQLLTLSMNSFGGGNIVVTHTGRFTATFNSAGDALFLVGIRASGSYVWAPVGNSGVVLA